MTDRQDTTPHEATPATPATIDLPLRGLAGDAADAATRDLGTVRGVLEAQVVGGAFRVRVTYDPTRVDAETIRERLHAFAPPDTTHADPRGGQDGLG